MNKRLRCMVGVLALFASISQASQAAQSSQEPGASPGRSNGGLPTPEEVVSRLGSKLSISDDQRAKITPLIADRQEKLKGVAADNSLRRMKKARKMKSIFQDSDQKIEAILNDDQRQQYRQIEQAMREQARQRMQANGNSSR